MKYNKIALIGMMGSGKSTISKLLSQELNFQMFEADEIFEQKEDISIKEYFKIYGEESFRKKENEILKELTSKKNFVLSCGGGIVLLEENQEILFNSDVLTIYLEAETKNIYNRIKNDNKRPLLQVENPEMEIEKILNSRKNLYQKAKIKIKTDGKSPQEITKEILEIIWKN